MKELTSSFDDVEKRLAIFFGLGALVLCSLYNLVNREPLEAFLVRGVAVAAVAILGGWAYGSYLRRSVAEAQPEEELPANVELRSQNAQQLGSGPSPLPVVGDTVIPAEASTGRMVDFTMPELSPSQAEAPAPMVPSAAVAQAAASTSAAPAAFIDEGDLPPPPVPSGVR